MNSDLFQLLINSSGAAAVTGLFVYYLIRRDRQDETREARFNGIVQDYLKESINVKKELAERLQKMADVLELLEDRLLGIRRKKVI